MRGQIQQKFSILQPGDPLEQGEIWPIVGFLQPVASRRPIREELRRADRCPWRVLEGFDLEIAQVFDSPCQLAGNPGLVFAPYPEEP